MTIAMLIEEDWVANSEAAEIEVAIFAIVTAHGLYAGTEKHWNKLHTSVWKAVDRAELC